MTCLSLPCGGSALEEVGVMMLGSFLGAEWASVFFFSSFSC